MQKLTTVNSHEATKKSPDIEQFLTLLSAHVAPNATPAMNKTRQQVVANNECMTCQSPNTKFRDDISIKEYRISGMCQDCQDSFFGVEEPA